MCIKIYENWGLWNLKLTGLINHGSIQLKKKTKKKTVALMMPSRSEVAAAITISCPCIMYVMHNDRGKDKSIIMGYLVL